MLEGVQIELVTTDETLLPDNVVFPSSSIGYALSHIGGATGLTTHLIRTRDGGWTWEPLELPAESMEPKDISFVDEEQGFVLLGPPHGATNLAERRLVRTTDGGTSWTAVGSSAPAKMSRIQFVTATLGFAFEHELWRTDDGGERWERLPIDARGLAFVSPSEGYATGGWGELWRTSDAGTNWELLPPEPGGLGLVAGAGGAVFRIGPNGVTRWSDAGRSVAFWPAAPFRITGLGSFDSETLFLAGKGEDDYGGTLLVSHDGGARWAQATALELIGDMPFGAAQIIAFPPDDLTYVVMTRAIMKVTLPDRVPRGVALNAIALPKRQPFAFEGRLTGDPKEACDRLGAAAASGSGVGPWPVPACGAVNGASVTFSCDGGETVASAPEEKRHESTRVVALDPQGDLLAVSGRSVLVSRDAGCTWSTRLELDAAPRFITPGLSGEAFLYGMSYSRLILRVGAMRAEALVGPPIRDMAGLAAGRAGRPTVRVADAKGQFWDLGADGTWTAKGDVPAPAGLLSSDTFHVAFNPADIDRAIAWNRTGAWLTTDAGKQWVEPKVVAAEGVSGAVFSPVDGNVVWMVADGRVVRSTDGGRSFSLPLDVGGKLLSKLVPDPTRPEVVHFVRLAEPEGGAKSRQLAHVDAKTATVTGVSTDAHVTSIAFPPGDGRIAYFGLAGPQY